MLALLILLLSTPVEPPRPTEMVISSSQPIDDLQTCTTRLWQAAGNITPTNLPDGVALDLQFHTTAMAGPGRALITFEIRDLTSMRTITVAYRHPLSGGAANAMLRKTKEKCAPDATIAERAAP